MAWTGEDYLAQYKPLFTRAELGCRHCGLVEFHPFFLEHLHSLREAFGKSMKVSSACRCRVHNLAVKGHPRSLHVGDHPQYPNQLGALAVDVDFDLDDGAYRGELFSVAWRLGWSIGWNGPKTFLHLDRRDFIGLAQTTFDY